MMRTGRLVEKTSDLLSDPGVAWLLRSPDPSVRWLTLTEVVGVSNRSADARRARAEIRNGPRVRALLQGQQKDGGFGIHPYKKWTGAHWRLVSLAELGLPAGDPAVAAAAGTVLDWLAGNNHRARIPTIDGRVRRCASQEGNALAACTRLGLTNDPRVRLLADSLLEWQWPDGGWNCDRRPEATHSSFHESFAPAWGLYEYHRATGERVYLEAAHRTADLFLRHRLFRSDRTGQIIHAHWLRFHWPVYWHYDVLQGLRIVGMLGLLRDPRADEALDLVESRRGPTGAWRAGGRHWRPPESDGSNVEAVDWGHRGPNEFVTLNALRVLKAAGRLG